MKPHDFIVLNSVVLCCTLYFSVKLVQKHNRGRPPFKPQQYIHDSNQ